MEYRPFSDEEAEINFYTYKNSLKSSTVYGMRRMSSASKKKKLEKILATQQVTNAISDL